MKPPAYESEINGNNSIGFFFSLGGQLKNISKLTWVILNL